MTLGGLRRLFADRLSDIYDTCEADGMFFRTVSHCLGMNRLEYAAVKDDELSETDTKRMTDVLNRLLQGSPLQYVLGIQRFAGHDFCVDGSVLIPRPETEELVQAILEGNARRDGLRVLDIGTGSGAIAVSLALAEPSWSVSAMDVSPQALATARENASRMGAQVEFIMADILSMQDGVPYGRYDVIVSNPPYVLESEKSRMHKNVLEYEPALALFVPDEDPLLFYRAISRFAAGARRQVILRNKRRSRRCHCRFGAFMRFWGCCGVEGYKRTRQIRLRCSRAIAVSKRFFYFMRQPDAITPWGLFRWLPGFLFLLSLSRTATWSALCENRMCLPLRG